MRLHVGGIPFHQGHFEPDCPFKIVSESVQMFDGRRGFLPRFNFILTQFLDAIRGGNDCFNKRRFSRQTFSRGGRDSLGCTEHLHTGTMRQITSGAQGYEYSYQGLHCDDKLRAGAEAPQNRFASVTQRGPGPT